MPITVPNWTTNQTNLQRPPLNSPIPSTKAAPPMYHFRFGSSCIEERSNLTEFAEDVLDLNLGVTDTDCSPRLVLEDEDSSIFGSSIVGGEDPEASLLEPTSIRMEVKAPASLTCS